ncbi:MAG TPA: outer membrane beta-barrel protein, partial [Chitinophagaceae bacterium]|nr:outer membrane beta-barrel protein [Chitinophagaceae bacterium]
KTGEVELDYIQFGQLASINISKYFSLMFGAQTAILLNAQVDSTTSGGTGGGTNPYGDIMDLYNRFDYGYAVGVEIHPVMGLIIGARYNVSLAKLYESFQTGQRPSFSSEDAKNNVIQISVGWRLGKYGKEKKEKKDADQ